MGLRATALRCETRWFNKGLTVKVERVIEVRVSARGFWGTTYWALDSIGRGAAWLLPRKISSSEEEVYAMTGGAIVGAVFGIALGFVLCNDSHDMSNSAGALLGGLIGVCTGIAFAATVQIVDDSINAWINSLRSR
jgi:hypothetical protein